jgi:hypothetical protein
VEIKNCVRGSAPNAQKGKRKGFNCEDGMVEKSKKNLAKAPSNGFLCGLATLREQ